MSHSDSVVMTSTHVTTLDRLETFRDDLPGRPKSFTSGALERGAVVSEESVRVRSHEYEDEPDYDMEVMRMIGSLSPQLGTV